jgi:hypothetical protein
MLAPPLRPEPVEGTGLGAGLSQGKRDPLMSGRADERATIRLCQVGTILYAPPRKGLDYAPKVNRCAAIGRDPEQEVAT